MHKDEAEPMVTNWGNASKTCSGIPQETAEHNRRELVAFCPLKGAGTSQISCTTVERNNSSAGADDQAQNRRM